ncbi:MAG: ATP-binding cassette domain-containing protein [Bacteroidota bacterium]
MIACHINKRLATADGYKEFQFDFEVPSGSFTAICGASGAGKTSLLRMISGLMRPDKGQIIYNKEIWFDQVKGLFKPIRKREVGFVFQDYTLFPNMTVMENLKFALSKEATIDLINQVITVMDLEGLIQYKPAYLSGGQQQRVALARAIVQKPKMLLLDEPLSALDISTQLKLEKYILKVHEELQCTTLFVGHDIDQIIRMADHVLVIKDQRVTSSASPYETFTTNTLNSTHLNGSIVNIRSEKHTTIASIAIGSDMVQVTLNEKDNFSVGDEVLLKSNTFNPQVTRILKDH